MLYSYSSDDESFSETLSGTKFTTTYSSQDTTDETTALETSETTTFGNLSKTVYSDAFGRITKEEIKNGNTLVSSKQYTYTANGDYITDQIETEIITIPNSEYSYKKYSYDNNGNITSIENLQSNGERNTYEYDALGQLIKENTTSFTYDTYGNITKKGAFAYYYEDSNWKDKLTKRVSRTIAYDESGNPTTYLNASLSWKNGRELASYSKGTTSVTYDYNESGLRTNKTVNSNGTITTYNYTWTEDKLTHQSWGNCYLHFYYDYNDEIVGFEYFDGTSSSYYAYLKNMQGDVVAVIDSSGNIVAQYSYDAWGKLKSPVSGLAKINPIRYRGYYYDTEISMYYLQSRYYDPNIGRFISADDTDYIGYTETMLSYNIYTYCENNSINKIDTNGNHAIILHAPDNVGTMGHMGLLFQWGSSWHYWYWGMKTMNGAIKYAITALVVAGGTPSLSLNIITTLSTYVASVSKLVFVARGQGISSSTTIKEIKKKLASVNAGYDGFKEGLFIKGDFTESFDYLLDLCGKKYNILYRNCMQTSIRALRKGTFDNNDKKNKNRMLAASLMIIPKLAYNYLKDFYTKMKKGK